LSAQVALLRNSGGVDPADDAAPPDQARAPLRWSAPRALPYRSPTRHARHLDRWSPSSPRMASCGSRALGDGARRRCIQTPWWPSALQCLSASAQSGGNSPSVCCRRSTQVHTGTGVAGHPGGRVCQRREQRRLTLRLLQAWLRRRLENRQPLPTWQEQGLCLGATFLVQARPALRSSQVWDPLLQALGSPLRMCRPAVEHPPSTWPGPLHAWVCCPAHAQQGRTQGHTQSAPSHVQAPARRMRSAANACRTGTHTVPGAPARRAPARRAAHRPACLRPGRARRAGDQRPRPHALPARAGLICACLRPGRAARRRPTAWTPRAACTCWATAAAWRACRRWWRRRCWTAAARSSGRTCACRGAPAALPQPPAG